MPVNIKGKEIYSWAKLLFPYNRSLTGDGNLKTFKFIKTKLKNLNLLKFPTNKKVFDWKVPYVWNVKDAYLTDSNNNKIIDFKKNN